jgi:hypothetical protein
MSAKSVSPHIRVLKKTRQKKQTRTVPKTEKASPVYRMSKMYRRYLRMYTIIVVGYLDALNYEYAMPYCTGVALSA